MSVAAHPQTQAGVSSLIEERMAKGDLLANNKWKDYVEDLQGLDRSFTALMLENTANYLAQFNEVSRAVNVGNFDRFAFPLIRAVFPHLIAQEIVSVQPMDNPVGLIFYFDFIYGTDKGRIKAGTPVFSSLTGHPGDDNFSSDVIEEEPFATGNGAVGYSKTLDYTPLVPQTLMLTDGTQVVMDDGNGNLVGDTGPGANTVNYETGAVSVTFRTAVPSGTPITATYRYVNEATDQVPAIDFQLTSAPVTARINKLRTRYSLEASQNLKALHGLDAETELVSALAEELKFEIDRTIIKDVFQFTQATSETWPFAPSTGVSFTEHKLSFVDIWIRLSNNIYGATRRGNPNFGVVGLDVASVIESLPGFQPATGSQPSTGVIYSGILNGRWRVYKDPYNITAKTNTNGQTNFFVGYKGSSFLEAGYVYAPYIPFYTTPSVILDDFIVRKGMATQWGRRKVNGRFYARGQITGTFTP